ncbi:hypothetical protein GCM10029964_009130 [Kibdelosporangium lantanae]
MEIQASREKARTGPNGEPVLLHEQNRGRWDQLLIRRGFTAMLKAREIGGPPGPYVLQAAIAVCHAQARKPEDTDWNQIAALYDALVTLLPTPIVQLNRAVAVGMARGPQQGLDLVEHLTTAPRLRDYHLVPGVRGDLLEKLGRHAEARQEFRRAAALTRNTAERDFLIRRAERIADATQGPRFGTAATDFLNGYAGETLRSYSQTMHRLRTSLGDEIPLTAITPAQIGRVFTTAWGNTKPRTWNRHRSTLRSFCEWAELPDLTAELDRKPEPPPPAREIDLTAVFGTDAPCANARSGTCSTSPRRP